MPDLIFQGSGNPPSSAAGGLVPPSGGPALAPPPPPPEYNGGWQVPNMGGAYQEMMQNYQVDKALKAIDASEQWLAQRGYQSDLQDGMSAAAAFTKWAPSLFKSGSGMSDAMNLQQPPSAMDAANLAYRKAQTQKLSAPAAPRAPVIRANAEGQIVSFGPDGKSTVLDATKKRVPPIKPPDQVNVEEEFPAVDATSGSPAVPAVKHWFKPDEPAIPAVPASAYKPKTIKRYVEQAKSAELNPAKPKTATNPKTGEKLQLIDGAWQPIPTQ